MANLDVLSERYVTEEMNYIFSKVGKILLEREFWLEVMKIQKEFGVHIPDEAIRAYEASINTVDLKRIDKLELILKHEPMNMIQAWNEAAGLEVGHIHKRMTSRDLTDNVEFIQILRAGTIIRDKYVSLIRHMKDKAEQYASLSITGRSHHQPAQLTTLGKRFAMWMEPILDAFSAFETWLSQLPFRGIKGPMGTQADMLDLLGSEDKCQELDNRLAKQFGFSRIMSATGQVYPRGIDKQLTYHMLQLAEGIGNYATTMRLMTGLELVTEGFVEGQVGSSAMPHKMNTSKSERLAGFIKILKMYNVGASLNMGAQWEEGDVECSLPRRLIIPGTFYAMDGLLETSLTTLNLMGAYPSVVSKEAARYKPFLASTNFLGIAIDAGLDREKAHDAIKSVLVGQVLAYREGRSIDYDVVPALASHPLFRSAGITEAAFKKALDGVNSGRAEAQTREIIERANKVIAAHHEAAKYEPKNIR
ncbi:MAG: lyase family protein [Candidatus Woesearchaeota archaeon]